MVYVTASAHRFRLDYEGQLLELSAQRDGLRTQVALFVDGEQVGDASGLGRVLAPLPVAAPVAASSTVKPDAGMSDGMGSEPLGPTVLVLSVLPGTVSRALLLVPRSDSTEPTPIPKVPTTRRLTMRRRSGCRRALLNGPVSSPPSATRSPHRRGHSRPGC